jgi:membrane protein YdbS with pleckstrin-like domain
MLYSLSRDLALRLMKAPTEPPDPPSGSDGDIQIYRASPRFLTYRLLVFWIIISLNWLVPWGILVAWLFQGETALLIFAILYAGLLAVIQFCVYFAIRIDYDMRYYIVTDRSLRIREGAFIVKEKTITFANVQNLRVVQGPIMRLFRIWHLKVDTAGGGASSNEPTERVDHRVQMAGIDNAHEVRDQIRIYLRSYSASTGLGDLDDHDDDAAALATNAVAFLDGLRELQNATSELRAALSDRNGHG